MASHDIYFIGNTFIPCERWETEHGAIRRSFWGVGFKTSDEAIDAVAAHNAGRDGPSRQLLPDSMVQRLAAMGRGES